MSPLPLSVSDLAFDVFGGWHNFTQGAAGAIVGVVGAYGVAVWTTRRELRRDRERSREDAGVEAAGQLIRALADLPVRIESTQDMEITSGSGVDYDRFIAWEKRRMAVEDQVAEHGTLLPASIEADAIELSGLLSNLMVADFDEEGGTIVFIAPGPSGAFTEATAQVERTLKGLQDYRRDPIAARKKTKG